MIKVRLANNSDAELIADMSRQTFTDTFAKDNTPEDMQKFLTEQFSREMLIAEVGAPKNIFLIAYDDQTPVGYCRIRENNIPPSLKVKQALEIARIYAISSSIGKGVGKTLIQSCIDIAIEKQIPTVWLGVWEKNQRAIEFYTKWGFRKFDEHPFILGSDVQTDWLMRLDLILPASK